MRLRIWIIAPAWGKSLFEHTKQRHKKMQRGVRGCQQTFVQKIAKSVGEKHSNESKERLSLAAVLLLWCDFIWITKKQKGFSKLGSECTNNKDKAAQNDKKTTLKCKGVLVSRQTQANVQLFDQFHPSFLMTTSLYLCVCARVWYSECVIELVVPTEKWTGAAMRQTVRGSFCSSQTGWEAERENSSRSKRPFQRDSLLLTVH